MRELVAFFAIAAFVGLLVWIAVTVCIEHRPQGYAMRVTKAAEPICPHFEAHPCARINCRRNIA